MSMTIDPELVKLIEKTIEDKVEKSLESYQKAILKDIFLTREDFLNEIEILVIITAHDHIINNFDLIKNKLILDTKNICKFDGAYKL